MMKLPSELIWLPSCRRGASLDRRDRQTRPAATTSWQARPLATAGWQTRPAATARARFCPLPVAGTSVWPARCRRGVSLAGEDRHTRPTVTASGQNRPAATTSGQTRPAATARARFCPLPVAGTSVWLAHCRRGVSLADEDRQTRPAATAGRQTRRLATARGPNCAPGDSPRPKLCIRRQRAARNSPWLSPDAQSVARRVARCTVWHASCRQMHSLVSRCRQARSPTKGSRCSLDFS